MAIELDQVGIDVVRIQFPYEVVIDRFYRDVTSYVITVERGFGEISVREAIPPTDGLTTSEVILYVDQPTKGTTYRIDITQLRQRDGTAVVETGRFEGRRTKLETMLQGVPSHWDKRPTSVMRNILAAISIEDDRIGGSRSDRL